MMADHAAIRVAGTIPRPRMKKIQERGIPPPSGVDRGTNDGDGAPAQATWHQWDRGALGCSRPSRCHQGMFLAKLAAEASLYWSLVGRRLIGRSVPLLMATLLLAFGCRPTPKPVVAANAPSPDIAELWSEPTDIAARDLLHGPGGPDLMPLPKSAFLRRLQEKVQMGRVRGGVPDER